MDLRSTHHILGCLAVLGQSVDPRWLESFEAFASDVLPVPNKVAGSPALRLYRINPELGWNKQNCAWAKPSGALYPCDEMLAEQAAERRAFLERETRRQNSCFREMEEAA